MEWVVRITAPTDRGFVSVEILRTGETIAYKIEPFQNTWTEREAQALRLVLRAADHFINA